MPSPKRRSTSASFDLPSRAPIPRARPHARSPEHSEELVNLDEGQRRHRLTFELASSEENQRSCQVTWTLPQFCVSSKPSTRKRSFVTPSFLRCVCLFLDGRLGDEGKGLPVIHMVQQKPQDAPTLHSPNLHTSVLRPRRVYHCQQQNSEKQQFKKQKP